MVRHILKIDREWNSTTVRLFGLKIFSSKFDGYKKTARILGIKIWIKEDPDHYDKAITTSLVSFLNIINPDATKNRVLVFEPNPYHGEVIPGYVRYILDLGYDVDILMNSPLFSMNPMARFQSDRVRCFCLPPLYMDRIVNDHLGPLYDKIFFTSYTPDLQKRFEPLQNRTYGVFHDGTNIPPALAARGLGVSLVRISDQASIRVANPHDFGTVRTEPNHGEYVTFISVGSMSSKVKNVDMMLTAALSLKKTGIDNFRIVLVGGTLPDRAIPEILRPHILQKGRLDYPSLYEEVEKADFFLPLLDPDTPHHDRYITTGATGTMQMVYGFLRPCIVHEKFSDFYGLTSKNSISYKNTLVDGMISALKMPPSAYIAMQQNLKHTVEDIATQSQHNMKLCLSS